MANNEPRPLDGIFSLSFQAQGKFQDQSRFLQLVQEWLAAGSSSRSPRAALAPWEGSAALAVEHDPLI
jgi:hypothetical protein